MLRYHPLPAWTGYTPLRDDERQPMAIAYEASVKRLKRAWVALRRCFTDVEADRAVHKARAPLEARRKFEKFSTQ